jgi:DNA-binding protein YbaB
VLEFTPRKISGFNQKEITMTAVATQIQTEALIATVTSDIDALFVLDQQAKALEAKIKALKADIANKYGEGEHKGELYSVSVKLVAVSGTVDYKKLCVAYNIQDDVLATFRKAGRADIRVTPTE